MKKHRTQPIFHIQHPLLYTAVLISLGLLSTTPLLANPKGGVFVGGQGKITQTPGITTIDQSSRRAVINWKDFSIGRSELTRFNQPGKNAIALNRVLGKDPSNILGQLKANGHVWLVNPNGVLIGPDAKVDVHGLLATTADIADQDFLAGRYHFSIPSPNPDASVVNQGLITIGQHGFGGLVAPHVRNSGVITGRLGQVVIAGAPTFTLDYYGDGLIQFAATSKVTESSDPSRPLVQNDGTISVDGGDILITANAAASVVEEVINTSGVIEARSFAVEDGVIVLMGGDEGTVNVAGVLDASGAEPGAAGGSVDVLGDKVLIADSAHINTSGPAGGGTVHIGGDLHGEGERQAASQTIVMPGAQITADATEAGDGGQIVVWADDFASIHGKISAKGGAESGDGGFIETSGKKHLNLTSTPDASALNGNGGEWLIDPADITIVQGSPPVIQVAAIDFGTTTVYADSISSALTNGTSVTMDTSTLPEFEEPGDITQTSGATITMSNKGAEQSFTATLTMNAENSIFLNDTIQVFLDDAFADAQLNVELNADIDGSNGGAIVMHPGSQISTNGGNVSIHGVGTTENNDGILLDSATINTDGGDINLTGTGSGGNSDSIGILMFSSALRSGTGSIDLSGFGGGDTGSFNRGINIQDGSILESTGNGNIDLSGFGGLGTDSLLGIFLTSSTVRSADGNIAFSGFGGDGTGNSNLGISIQVDSTVESTGNGDISIAGFGGTGSDSLTGIFLFSSTVRSAEGNIVFSGFGGDGSETFNDGISIQAGSTIESTGNGSIDISGDGGTGTDSATGIFLSASDIRSVQGGINLSGFGGEASGSFNHGIDIQGSSTIESTGNGDITIGGFGGGIDGGGVTNHGINMQGSSTVESTGNGSITLSGHGGTGAGDLTGIFLDSATIRSGQGSIDLAGFGGDGNDIGRGLVLQAGATVISSGGANLILEGAGGVNNHSILATDTSGISTAGTTTLIGGPGDIDLDNSNNNFGKVVIESARDAFISDVDGIELGDIDISGELFVTADTDSGFAPGGITVSGHVNSGFLDNSLFTSLDAQGNIAVLNTGSITAQHIEIFTGLGDITIDGAINAREPDPDFHSTIHLIAENGSFSNSARISTNPGSVFIFANDININGDIAASGPGSEISLDLTSVCCIAQDINTTLTADILTMSLPIEDSGSIENTVHLNGQNKINNLFPRSVQFGTFEITNDQDLLVGGISANSVRLDINGVLTLDAPIVANSAGDSIVIHANGFNNPLVEQTGLQAGAGRFLVYSESTPDGDERGNLDDISNRIYDRNFATDPPATITEEGSLFLYDINAVLSVIADNLVVEYGEPIDLTGFIDPSGLIEGDTLADSVTGEADFSLDPDLRPDVPVSGSPYVILSENGTLESPLGYKFEFVNGELTITPAPLTVTVNDANREYGDSNPAFDALYEGFKLGQDESVLGNIFFDSSANEASPVAGSPYSITMTGFENTNYVLDGESTTDGDLTITPAPLTIAVNDADREYGDPNPDFDALYIGFKLGQDESVLGEISIDTVAAESSPVAGNPYAIIMDTSGIDNTNYDLVSVTDGDLTITPALLSVLVNDASREYGDPNPAFTALYEGFKLGQDESVLGITLGTPADEASPVADSPYAITVTDFNNTNYLAAVTDGELTITPALLSVLVNDASREYGDANPAFDALYEGFKLGQDESVLGNIFFDSTADAASPVAGNPYSITMTGFENTNYVLDGESTTDGDLTITPAPLTIAVNDADREYGDPNPDFDALYIGFKLGQDESVLGEISIDTVADTSSPVAGNPYAIIMDTSGIDNTNYDLVSVTDGDLTITPAPLTVAVNDASREYGDPNPAFTALYEGFKLEQDESVLGNVFFDTPAEEASPVAGNPYAITMAGFENTNYVLFSVADGELTITPAPLTVSVNNANREYGDQNPDFNALYEGFKLGENESVLGLVTFDTTANAASPVSGNPYPIAFTGFESTNYVPAEGSSFEAELAIERAPLSITADDKERGFGEEDPDFTVTYEGFKLDEDPSVVSGLVVESDAKQQSLPDDYSIRPTSATASNYSIQHVNGTLKVSTGDIPSDDINIIPQIQPDVPVDKNFITSISAIPPGTPDGLFSVSGLEFLTQQADQQLNPEVNKLLGPNRNQQGDQQDDLLFSNDGNHELWGR